MQLLLPEVERIENHVVAAVAETSPAGNDRGAGESGLVKEAEAGCIGDVHYGGEYVEMQSVAAETGELPERFGSYPPAASVGVDYDSGHCCGVMSGYVVKVGEPDRVPVCRVFDDEAKLPGMERVCIVA